MAFNDHNYACAATTSTSSVCSSVATSLDDIQSVGNKDPFCLVCGKLSNGRNESLVCLGPKGIKTILASATVGQRHDITEYVAANTGDKIFVHNYCRCMFNKKRMFCNVDSDSSQHQNFKRKLRSKSGHFDYSTTCILCGLECQFDRKKCRKNRKVATMEFRDTLLAACDERNDDWGLEVRGRLQHCTDLVADEAVYHITCRYRFVHKQDKFSGHAKRGRPINEHADKAFQKVCRELEKSCEYGLFTLNDLHSMMKNFLRNTDFPETQQHEETAEAVDKEIDENNNEGTHESADDNVYSKVYLQKRLQKHYGEHLYFAQVCGRKNVVCFKT
jgi:hypothetical protein